jgi:hypothetical protein
VLEKVLEQIAVNSRGVRTILLNSLLLVALAAAWISDTWPGLAVPAFFVAFAIVAGAIALLYSAAKRARKKDGQRPEAKRDASVAALRGALRDRLATRFGERVHESNDQELPPDRRPLVRDSDDVVDVLLRLLLHFAPSSRQFALPSSRQFALEYRHAALFLRKVSVPFERHEQQRQLTPELAKWKFVSRNENVFNVEAGAFAIEHFHGHTNIRVLDPSRVTVEGSVRGKSIENLPPEVRPPAYN